MTRSKCRHAQTQTDTLVFPVDLRIAEEKEEAEKKEETKEERKTEPTKRKDRWREKGRP